MKILETLWSLPLTFIQNSARTTEKHFWLSLFYSKVERLFHKTPPRNDFDVFAVMLLQFWRKRRTLRNKTTLCHYRVNQHLHPPSLNKMYCQMQASYILEALIKQQLIQWKTMKMDSYCYDKDIEQIIICFFCLKTISLC